jgi:hypothetical protein
MAGAIAQDWESYQFPFVLDEKATVVASGRKAVEKGVKGPLSRRSVELRAAPSACIGRQF